MKVTQYSLITSEAPVRVAFLADLHNMGRIAAEEALERLTGLAPQLILIAGDIVHKQGQTKNGIEFVRRAARLAPVFCSLGNHEAKCGENVEQALTEAGATVLCDRFVRFGSLVIGGLGSGYTAGVKQGRLKRTPPPQLGWLAEFCRAPGVHILLSHHPEYFPRYLWERPIELVLSGHAHGGQWQIFGRGVFAPGQGLFPRYTHGGYRKGERVRFPARLTAGGPLMIVSRGVYNSVSVPRFCNPEELIYLDIGAEEK